MTTSLSALQYRRISTLLTALELAEAHLEAARRECWLDLPEGDRLREDNIATMLERMQDELNSLVVELSARRVRALNNAAKEL